MAYKAIIGEQPKLAAWAKTGTSVLFNRPPQALIWSPGQEVLKLSPTCKHVNVGGLFGQRNIANILSWLYLRDP